MKRHLFFTGDKRSGKSTALQRYVKESGLRAAGLITLRLACVFPAGPSVHMFSAGTDGKAYATEIPCEENRLVFCANKTPSPEIGERFDRIGCGLLEHIPPETELIILDEIGPMESYAAKFQETILNLLDGEIPVAGVLQWGDYGFAEKIKAHERVQVVEIRK